MIWCIARKEIIDHFRDGRFRVSSAIIGAVLATGLLTGWAAYRDATHERARAQRTAREQWLAQGDKNPHSAAHYSIYAFRPVGTLAFVDQGVTPYVGLAAWLEAHKQNDFSYRPARDATAAGRFGSLTAAVILQILLPLLIISMGFSACAGERESGTWRQLLSLGVSPGTIASGKVLGLSATLATILVPATIVCAAVLTFAESASGSLGRAALMAVAYLLYLATWILITLLVSATARSSRAALLLLLAGWMVTLVLPRITSDLARSLYPTPSALSFGARVAADMRNGIDGHNPADKRAAELLTRVLAEYKVDREEHLPINFMGISL
jgi:ABC-2 type transport system permease protein